MIKQEIEFTPITSDIRVSRYLSAQLQHWRTQTLTHLQQEPGKPKYPIRWTTLRQKRAFFASDGFGRGIPTKRTHKLSQSWDVTVNIQQISLFENYRVALITFLTKFGIGTAPTPPPPSIWVSVSNPVDYERFVTGTDQQGFHHDTGWYQSPQVIDSAFQQLEGIIESL